jgi:hypothetical protein
VHSKASASAKAAAAGGSKPPLAGPVKERRLSSPACRIADFGTNISVEDYLVGKLTLSILPTSARTSPYLFLLDEVFNQYRGAGPGEGQLAVVPPLVTTTSPIAVVGAKGAARDP